MTTTIQCMSGKLRVGRIQIRWIQKSLPVHKDISFCQFMG